MTLRFNRTAVEPAEIIHTVTPALYLYYYIILYYNFITALYCNTIIILRTCLCCSDSHGLTVFTAA